MAAISNYLEGKIADWLKGTNLPSAPTAYLGLWDGNPTDTGSGGTEESGTISARQTITFGAPQDDGIYREIENSAEIDFGTSAGSATVDYFAIMDALTSGNQLFNGSMTSKTINTSDDVTVAAGALSVQLSGDFTNYMCDLILNWVKGTAAASAPSNVYVALFNGDPAGAGTEVTTTIRAAGRVAVTFGTVTDGAMSNSVDTDFGNADGGATVDYFALYDASSGGNMLCYAALAVSKTVVSGDPVKFAAGDIDITIA